MSTKFCRLLRAMIKDEKKAFPEYTTLMKAGWDAELPKGELSKIGNNRFDEKRHHSILKGIESRNCRVK